MDMVIIIPLPYIAIVISVHHVIIIAPAAKTHVAVGTKSRNRHAAEIFNLCASIAPKINAIINVKYRQQFQQQHSHSIFFHLFHLWIHGQ